MAVADGVDLVFNTPNEKSGAGYLTMGWKKVGPIGAMVRPSPRFLTATADGDNPEAFIEKPGAGHPTHGQ